MTTAGAYIFALALAAALLAAGIFLVRRPEKASRMFSFGRPQDRFGVKFFRAAGWFYVCGGAAGVLMVVTAAVMNYMRMRQP